MGEPRISAADARAGSHHEDRGDFGLGGVVSDESKRRLLNRDGTFNVRRVGLGWLRSQSAYHTALSVSWPKFLWVSAAVWAGLNVLFASAFLLCGPESLAGAEARELGGSLWRAFFFSVETFATIGYGDIAPLGFAPHLIMTVESLVALLSQALITGLLFARFARPVAAISFSRNMLVAPFRGGRALMFRVSNIRNNQLIDLRARVNCSWIARNSEGVRKYTLLALERADVIFFPLAWTIVHPITEESPLWGLTDAQLRAHEYEFLIIITAIDETFAQQVHARSSYRPDEIVWGAKFRNIFNPPDEHGMLTVDVRRLHDYDPAELPA